VEIHFFSDNFGKQTLTFAGLLMPLKCLAYGISPSGFKDYFQMSYQMANDCQKEFDKAICELYTHEYLRKPSPEDLAAIEQLHFCRHNTRGMYGSLDCMHVFWKQCPKAWQQSYKGKENKPSIVLEAVCDYNLWFWHSFFGSGGSFNDLNVLDVSNLLQMFLDGSLDSLEDQSGVVPFKIGAHEFGKLFLLVDGIYPLLSRFVKGIKDPVDDVETSFNSWQEGARKDIERAFGVLQGRFQWTARPVHMFDLDNITRRMKTCLILHNMGVSDRIMENDVYATYNPAFGLSMSTERPDRIPTDLEQVPETINFFHDPALAKTRWESLNDKEDHYRLKEALKQHFK
jgi:hypothetical protein